MSLSMLGGTGEKKGARWERLLEVCPHCSCQHRKGEGLQRQQQLDNATPWAGVQAGVQVGEQELIKKG